MRNDKKQIIEIKRIFDEKILNEPNVVDFAEIKTVGDEGVTIPTCAFCLGQLTVTPV